MFSLPGDNWHEMKDIWVCACTTEMLNSSKTISTGHIRGQEGKILIGSDHILMHGTDVNISLLAEDKNASITSRKLEWKGLQCCRCRSIVGRYEINTEKRMSNIVLYKHALRTSLSGTNAFSYHQLETYISSQILQNISNYGYRYVIRNLNNRENIVYINVLNWNMLMHTNSVSNQYTHPFPCIRLTLIEEELATKSYKEEHNFGVLFLPEEDCYSILILLNERSNALPPPYRFLGGLKASYIHYVPFEE